MLEGLWLDDHHLDDGGLLLALPQLFAVVDELVLHLEDVVLLLAAAVGVLVVLEAIAIV